jgi:hypothetical protein
MGVYDQSVSQLLPPDWAEKAPRAYEVLQMTSGWFPWWGWVILLLVIVTGAVIEHGVRTRKRLPASDTPELEPHFLGRQVSVGEVRCHGFNVAERRLSLFVKGHNATAHTILAADPKGSIGVVGAQDNTGRPRVRDLLPDNRAGRPSLPGIPPGEGFELIVEAQMSERVALHIEQALADGHQITLDLSPLELAVFPSGHLETQVRLSLPESINVKRVDGGYYSTRNVTLGTPFLQNTPSMPDHIVETRDAKGEAKD